MMRGYQQTRAGERMADIFVSYTTSDRDWAFWIAKELEELGHMAHVHEWRLQAAKIYTAGWSGVSTPRTTYFASSPMII